MSSVVLNSSANGSFLQSTVADVLVIGAGPSGLATAAVFLNAGYNVLVLEQSPAVGGWSCKVDSKEGCRGPVECLLFSDANFTDNLPDEPMGEDALLYLTSYAAYYNIMDHVRLSCRVTNLAFDATCGRWRAIFQELALGKYYQAAADFVVLCVGHSLPESRLLYDSELSQVPWFGGFNAAAGGPLSGAPDDSGVGAVASGAGATETAGAARTAAAAAAIKADSGVAVVMSAGRATMERITEGAAAAVAVIGDGETAVDCALAVSLLRQGRTVTLVKVPTSTAAVGTTTVATTAVGTATNPCVNVTDGKSLLESARRRALNATLQPHPTLQPPGLLRHALRAPTKRRFWAYIKGRLEAIMTPESQPTTRRSQGTGSGATGGSGGVSRDRFVHPSLDSSVADDSKPAVVLWAPSFRDSRVLSFLEPALKEALLQDEAEQRQNLQSQHAADQLVLYRGMIHPNVPGLAFVGWQAHDSTPLMVLELQAHWLLALLTGRLIPPSPTNMRRDIGRQRYWRAATLVSPLMSTHGSLARTHDDHNVRQLLSDLVGIVEVRQQHWEPGSEYSSVRPLLGSCQSIVRGRGGCGLSTRFGGCFGTAFAITTVPSGTTEQQSPTSMAEQRSDELFDRFIPCAAAPAVPGAAHYESTPRPDCAVRQATKGTTSISAGNDNRNSKGNGNGTTGGWTVLTGRLLAHMKPKRHRDVYQGDRSSPSLRCSCSIAAGGAAPPSEPPPVLTVAAGPFKAQQQHLLTGTQQTSRSRRRFMDRVPPSSRRTSTLCIDSGGCGGGTATVSPLLTMLVPQPSPMAPYLQNKLRRTLQKCGMRTVEQSVGNAAVEGDCGGSDLDRTQEHVPSVSPVELPNHRGCLQNHRQRSSAAAIIFGSWHPRRSPSDDNGIIVGDGMNSRKMLLMRRNGGSAGGCATGSDDNKSFEAREAELSARLRRLSHSTGVHLSTLVDLVTDDSAAGIAVQHGTPWRPSDADGGLTDEAILRTTLAPAAPAAGVFGSIQPPELRWRRWGLLKTPSRAWEPLFATVGFLEGETMDEEDINFMRRTAGIEHHTENVCAAEQSGSGCGKTLDGSTGNGVDGAIASARRTAVELEAVTAVALLPYSLPPLSGGDGPAPSTSMGRAECSQWARPPQLSPSPPPSPPQSPLPPLPLQRLAVSPLSSVSQQQRRAVQSIDMNSRSGQDVDMAARQRVALLSYNVVQHDNVARPALWPSINSSMETLQFPTEIGFKSPAMSQWTLEDSDTSSAEIVVRSSSGQLLLPTLSPLPAFEEQTLLPESASTQKPIRKPSISQAFPPSIPEPPVSTATGTTMQAETQSTYMTCHMYSAGPCDAPLVNCIQLTSPMPSHEPLPRHSLSLDRGSLTHGSVGETPLDVSSRPSPPARLASACMLSANAWSAALLPSPFASVSAALAVTDVEVTEHAEPPPPSLQPPSTSSSSNSQNQTSASFQDPFLESRFTIRTSASAASAITSAAALGTPKRTAGRAMSAAEAAPDKVLEALQTSALSYFRLASVARCSSGSGGGLDECRSLTWPSDALHKVINIYERQSPRWNEFFGPETGPLSPNSPYRNSGGGGGDGSGTSSSGGGGMWARTLPSLSTRAGLVEYMESNVVSPGVALKRTVLCSVGDGSGRAASEHSSIAAIVVAKTESNVCCGRGSSGSHMPVRKMMSLDSLPMSHVSGTGASAVIVHGSGGRVRGGSAPTVTTTIGGLLPEAAQLPCSKRMLEARPSTRVDSVLSHLIDESRCVAAAAAPVTAAVATASDAEVALIRDKSLSCPESLASLSGTAASAASKPTAAAMMLSPSVSASVAHLAQLGSVLHNSVWASRWFDIEHSDGGLGVEHGCDSYEGLLDTDLIAELWRSENALDLHGRDPDGVVNADYPTPASFNDKYPKTSGTVTTEAVNRLSDGLMPPRTAPLHPPPQHRHSWSPLQCLQPSQSKPPPHASPSVVMAVASKKLRSLFSRQGSAISVAKSKKFNNCSAPLPSPLHPSLQSPIAVPAAAVPGCLAIPPWAPLKRRSFAGGDMEQLRSPVSSTVDQHSCLPSCTTTKAVTAAASEMTFAGQMLQQTGFRSTGYSPPKPSCSNSPLDVNETLLEAARWRSTFQQRLPRPSITSPLLQQIAIAPAFNTPVAGAATATAAAARDGDIEASIAADSIISHERSVNHQPSHHSRNTNNCSFRHRCIRRQKQELGAASSSTNESDSSSESSGLSDGRCMHIVESSTKANQTILLSAWEQGAIGSCGSGGGSKGISNDRASAAASSSLASIANTRRRLMQLRGPAWTVRQESQERQDRLISEITARLKEALARKADGHGAIIATASMGITTTTAGKGNAGGIGSSTSCLEESGETVGGHHSGA